MPLTNVAYEEATMAAIEVIFSLPLAQSKPLRHPSLPCANFPDTPSVLRYGRGVR